MEKLDKIINNPLSILVPACFLADSNSKSIQYWFKPIKKRSVLLFQISEVSFNGKSSLMVEMLCTTNDANLIFIHFNCMSLHSVVSFMIT
jgi:hypothetical protein